MTKVILSKIVLMLVDQGLTDCQMMVLAVHHLFDAVLVVQIVIVLAEKHSVRDQWMGSGLETDSHRG